MGEANEKKNRSREMHNLSLEIEKYPRDLLRRFMPKSETEQSHDEGTENTEEEIELNLGLSLGGRFGVDTSAKKKLLRSSSIAGSIPMFREIETAATTVVARSAPAATYPPLSRTSSLPTETEEEWRKRKELQTLRRMEAKRRRSEKQRNLNSNANASASAGVNINPKLEKMDLSVEEDKHVSGPFGMPSWAAAARQVIFGGGGSGSSGGVMQGLVQPCSQGSVESQGGSSSGMSELESKPFQGILHFLS